MSLDTNNILIMIVSIVLGSIIGGIAAPTEAASMGALGAIAVTALGRRFTNDVIALFLHDGP